MPSISKNIHSADSLSVYLKYLSSFLNLQIKPFSTSAFVALMIMCRPFNPFCSNCLFVITIFFLPASIVNLLIVASASCSDLRSFTIIRTSHTLNYTLILVLSSIAVADRRVWFSTNSQYCQYHALPDLFHRLF